MNYKKHNAFVIVSEWFEQFGYSVLDKPSPEDNGCDMIVVGKKKTLRVEIKYAKQKKNGTWQASAITKRQKTCDCCAVILPKEVVFVEPMSEYLSHCSKSGYRSFTWLKL